MSDFLTEQTGEVTNMTDKELYRACREYGARAVEWRRRFLGLLPEVHRRRLWEAKGFSSIYEFAGKLCGVSPKLVQRVLQVDARFADKPQLRELLVSGEVSVHKLIRVASVATPKNQGYWSNNVKKMSIRAVETLVRDEKWEKKKDRESVHVNTLAKIKGLDEFELDDELRERLRELKQKGFDVNQLLNELLDQREESIQREKDQIAQKLKPAKSRYVRKKVRTILEKEHGAKCSIKSCMKPKKVIHHTQRFSVAKWHDPLFMAPLCKEHHEIAHIVDLKYTNKKQPQVGG